LFPESKPDASRPTPANRAGADESGHQCPRRHANGGNLTIATNNVTLDQSDTHGAKPATM